MVTTVDSPLPGDPLHRSRTGQGDSSMRRACYECVVRNRALCASLTDEEVASLGRLGRRRGRGRRLRSRLRARRKRHAAARGA